MSWRGARALVLVAAAALALLSSTHDDGSDDPELAAAPSVTISVPDVGPVLVRSSSFEIGGSFGGAVTSIDVSIDGVDLGRASPGEPGDWRLPASRVDVAPGLHDIRATATGSSGSSTDQLWVFYEPDRATAFTVAVVPDAATYAQEGNPDDARLIFFGPGFGDDFPLDVSVDDHPGVTASTNERMSTGTATDLVLELRDPAPGTYPIVVRAVDENGDEATATHTVTISEPRPTTPPTPTPGAGTSTVVLSDDFEGAHQWTATVAGSTNGAAATADPAGGGNPGGHRRMTHVLPGTDDGENNPTTISVVHLYLGGGWEPAIDGALARIDYSEDVVQFEPPFEGAAIGALFVIVQDGTTYTAPVHQNNAFTTLTWATARAAGLTAGDFSPAPGPDFSASGGPMTFGYLRSNTNRNSAAITTQHGIDNWTVELVTQ